MKFLVPFHGSPESVAAGGLMGSLGLELARRGHSVDFVGSSRERRGEVTLPYERVRGFCLPAAPFNRQVLAKARYLGPLIAMHTDSSLRNWLETRYDVALVHTPALLTGDLLPLLKRRAQVSAVGMFMWDFFPRAQIEAGVFPPRVDRVLAPVERSLVRYVDVAFPMSPRGSEFTREYFHRSELPCVVVPPWGSEVVLTDSDEGPLHEHITVVWGGQFSKRRAVGDILAVAQRMRSERPDVRFRFAGAGPLREQSERFAREHSLSNVMFDGVLERTDYHRWLSRADIALSAIEPGSTPSYPSKTVDYAQRSLPIVASVESGNDFGTILESWNAGVSVPAGDVDAMVRALVSMAGVVRSDTARTMQHASRRLFDEELNVTVAAGRVEHAFA